MKGAGPATSTMGTGGAGIRPSTTHPQTKTDVNPNTSDNDVIQRFIYLSSCKMRPSGSDEAYSQIFKRANGFG